MAIRLPRRLKLGFTRSFARAKGAAVFGLSALIISPAAAQVDTAGRSSPAVTVDDGVIDRLGPPAAAKTPPSRTAKAPAKTSIHLIPPKSRVAGAAPKPSGKTGNEAVSQHEATSGAGNKPSVAALAGPATIAAPKPSASNDALTVPPPPQLTPAPSQPAAAATPPSPAAQAPAVAAATPPPSTNVAPTSPAAAPPMQTAAATAVGSAEIAIKFKSGVTDLGGGAQPALDTLVSRMLASPGLRVELISHAIGTADDAMEARRVSLARAVAVRAYLVEKGVQSLRIDVRALGNRADKGPIADQVELQLVSQ